MSTADGLFFTLTVRPSTTPELVTRENEILLLCLVSIDVTLNTLKNSENWITKKFKTYLLRLFENAFLEKYWIFYLVPIHSLGTE